MLVYYCTVPKPFLIKQGLAIIKLINLETEGSFRIESLKYNSRATLLAEIADSDLIRIYNKKVRRGPSGG